MDYKYVYKIWHYQNTLDFKFDNGDQSWHSCYSISLNFHSKITSRLNLVWLCSWFHTPWHHTPSPSGAGVIVVREGPLVGLGADGVWYSVVAALLSVARCFPLHTQTEVFQPHGTVARYRQHPWIEATASTEISVVIVTRSWTTHLDGKMIYNWFGKVTESEELL